MSYDRINWENAPSTQTPLNADNLNNMDEALANLDTLVAAANELMVSIQQAIDLIDARIDTIVTRPDGATGIHNVIDGSATGSVRTIGAIDAGNDSLGLYAFAEGKDTRATGGNSHAEGSFTLASDYNAHAEGYQTTASGSFSHAEGLETTASGGHSHAEGYKTIAKHLSQHVFGDYNIPDPSTNTRQSKGNYIEIVGNGTADNALSNARTLDWQGNEKLAGGLTLGMGTANEVTITPAQLAALLNLLN